MVKEKDEKGPVPKADDKETPKPEYIIETFQRTLKGLLFSDGITRIECEIPGTDWRVIGYRLSRNPSQLRFDVKKFVFQGYERKPEDEG